MPTFNYGKHLEKVCTIKLEDGQQDPNKCPNFLRIEKFLFESLCVRKWRPWAFRRTRIRIDMLLSWLQLLGKAS